MDYKNGKIYTIRSFQTDEIYIGSCATTLVKRLSGHKKNYNGWKNGNFSYVTSFEILKYDDYYIELLENFPCNSKDELKQREGYYQRNMDCVNKYIAGRTQKEWCEDNKEKIRKRNKKYETDNKDKIKERKQNYYENNKDEIKQKRKEKKNCDCGEIITKESFSRHKKGKKHQEYLSKE